MLDAPPRVRPIVLVLGSYHRALLLPRGAESALDIPFLAGDHYTMDARWHKDVGTILAYSLVIQAIVGCFVPFAPGVVHMLKKKMKMGGVMHR